MPTVPAAAAGCPQTSETLTNAGIGPMDNCPCGLPWVAHESNAVKAAKVGHFTASSPHLSSGEAMEALRSNVSIATPCMKLPACSLADVLSSPVLDPPTTGAAENAIQQWLMAVSAALERQNVSSVLHAEKSPKETLSMPNKPLKPDGMVYAKGFLGVTGGEVAVIELKAPGMSILSNDTTLQLFNYLHAILCRQPARVFCYGIATNGNELIVYRAQRVKNPQKMFKYVAMWSGTFSEGKNFLAWFVTAKPSELGFEPPVITIGGAEVELVHYLGSGQFSHGYEISLPGSNTAVVKQFCDKDVAQLERGTCELLRGVSNVAQLFEQQPDEELFVAITPKGLRFDPQQRPINSAHVNCLREALVALHAKGKVHGDVCAANIYFLDQSRALLNDWSHVRDATDVDTVADLFSLVSAVKEVGGNVHLQAQALGNGYSDRLSKRGRE